MRSVRVKTTFLPISTDMPPSTSKKIISRPIEIDAPPRVADCDVTASGLISEDRGPMPSAESLRAARSMLLAEYGPCVACHAETLIATARRLDATR